MKLFKRMTMALTTGVLCFVMASSVFADSNIKEVKITGTTTEGKTVDVYLTEDFDPEGTEIKAVAPENTKSIEIVPTLSDENATYKTDWTDMDPGDNTSHIYVTGSDYVKKTYNVYTTLSDDQYNEYVQQHDEAESDLEVILTNNKYYVQKKLKGIDLPEGYERKRIEYHGTKVWSAYSRAKDTYLLYLVNESGNGNFFIYDEKNDTLRILREIKVKSRLYTVVYPKEKDKRLKKYEKETIRIGTDKVRVWVKSEEEGLYLLYLMNWDGEVNLYQFDSKENVFQRFIINDSAEEALDTADKTIAEQDEKYNDFVKKYNKENSLKWKVIIGLIIAIVALVFVILNLFLKIASQKRQLKEAQEKAVRATGKKSKYLVEKPGIKTVVPNQKIEKKSKDDVDMKSVTPTGYDDLSIDMTDDVKKEFEKQPAKAETKVEARKAEKTDSVKTAPVKSPLKADSKSKNNSDDDDDDDGFEFIVIDD